MTTCPLCDRIRLDNVSITPFRTGWHVGCNCGFAWHWGSPSSTKKKAKDSWEIFLREWEKNQLKESKE